MRGWMSRLEEDELWGQVPLWLVGWGWAKESSPWGPSTRGSLWPQEGACCIGPELAFSGRWRSGSAAATRTGSGVKPVHCLNLGALVSFDSPALEPRDPAHRGGGVPCSLILTSSAFDPQGCGVFLVGLRT